MTDLKRNLEKKIETLLTLFPVVAIVGARQTGKTTIAQRVTQNWKYCDLQNPDDFDRIKEQPLFFFEQYPRHVILDEAQEYPELFAILRGVIDKHRKEKGRFILTGSSSPELISHISESLAGRIGIVELGTLKINEFYEKPLSKFYDLFSEPLASKNVVQGVSPFTSKEIQTLWLKGGYPEALLQETELGYTQWMENYRDTYINRDIAKLFPRLNKLAYRRFLTILCKLSSTILNKRDVARSLEINEKTVTEYLQIAEGTYLWRSLTSFEKNIIKSIIKMPKGHIRDTGLLHYLLRIHTKEALLEDPIIGNSFEGFVIEELIKGLQATFVTNWQPHYYRTRNGAEIDLILEGPFGTLPIEIKYGTSVKIKQLTTLSAFIQEHHLPFGMVINQSHQVEWLTPHIVQVPIGWL